MAWLRGDEASVVKAACDLVGRHGSPVRPPTGDMSAEHRAEFKLLLQKIGVPGVVA
jgi:hypothetical protein